MNIIGKRIPAQRVITGFYSLDRAFMDIDGAIGMPVGMGYEVMGNSYVGKSSLVYSLAGILAKHFDGNIVLGDLEGLDFNYLKRLLSTVGFDNDVAVLSSKKDEEILSQLADNLTNPKTNCVVGILDSIGAIVPLMEREGELGEANMGKRAFLMAQFTRSLLPLFREGTNRTLFATNHWYPKIGGMGKESPGGEVKKYLFRVRIVLNKLWQAGSKSYNFPDGSYVLEGEITKNSFGSSNTRFHIFMVYGIGMHPGLSVMWDAVMAKKATYKSGIIKIGDTSYGRLSNIVKMVKTGQDTEDFFKDFYGVMEDGTENNTADDTNSEVGESDNLQD